MKKTVTAIISIFTVAILCGCGSNTPEKAYDKLCDAAKAQNWGKVYDMFSSQSKAQIDVSMKMLAGMSAAFSQDKKAADTAGKSGRDLFISAMDSEDAKSDPVKIGKVKSSTVNGDNAKLVIDSDGTEQTISLTKEDGEWKFNMM